MSDQLCEASRPSGFKCLVAGYAQKIHRRHCRVFSQNIFWYSGCKPPNAAGFGRKLSVGMCVFPRITRVWLATSGTCGHRVSQSGRQVLGNFGCTRFVNKVPLAMTFIGSFNHDFARAACFSLLLQKHGFPWLSPPPGNVSMIGMLNWAVPVRFRPFSPSEAPFTRLKKDRSAVNFLGIRTIHLPAEMHLFSKLSS